MLFVYGIAAWLVFMVTAIVNGAFREVILPFPTWAGSLAIGSVR